MEKRKEGRPGEARAALRRSVRENGYVSIFRDYLSIVLISFTLFLLHEFIFLVASCFWPLSVPGIINSKLARYLIAIVTCLYAVDCYYFYYYYYHYYY